MSDGGSDGAGTIEVAHEALLREWPRLATWIREHADDLRLIRQVEAAAREWEQRERAELYAWPHERLAPVYDAFEQLEIEQKALVEPTRSFVRPEWERLVEELQIPTTSHDRRAEIGDRLDHLGDPRPGVGVLADGTPDIVWCEVPDGEVDVEELGQFEVASFRIAKYPVTYAQYKAFLNDQGGYTDRTHWTDLERAETPGEQFRRIDNCPAENVSWYDAMAFCRWLERRLHASGALPPDATVRLPNEWEWQQAATGGRSESIYPWGPEWNGDVANTYESRLSRTTAVGMYPNGTSHQKVLDLAGNVWEWCLNPYDKGTKKKKEVRRVLRGGSWGNLQDGARASYRGSNDPDARYYFIGFRVVCVSPIP